jgi:hypothetical protein
VSLFRAPERPIRLEDAGLPAEPPAAAAAAGSTEVVTADEPPAPEVRPPEKKKRGFWSKLFGLGGDR